MKKICAVLLPLLVFAACHPFSMFRPPAVAAKLNVSDVQAIKLPHDEIQVAIDDHGIPFIRARSIEQAIYGLGFMHARDRLFQLDLLRHAALGKTTELFGEKTLYLDRKLRLLTYKLDEQLKYISDDENRLLDSYVQGINDGAKQRGRTAEHFLLGQHFEELSKRDVIAISRLQAWQLGADLFAEIMRLRVARSDIVLAAKHELLTAVDARGSAIIDGRESLLSDKSEGPKKMLALPSYLNHEQRGLQPELIPAKAASEMEGGASNAWVVSKALAKDGHAVLMNDPHLPHAWPSNFYLATLSAEDFFVTGATFVGLPAVLIGASEKISWGVTASYLNTQDSVLLDMDGEQEGPAHLVEQKSPSLKPWPQTYCFDKSGRCIEEMNYHSQFGPVVDQRFDRFIAKADRLAVQWTGFHVSEHKRLAGGFIDLAQASTVKEAVGIINSMTLPGVNLVVADTKGSIAFAYAGLVPKRDRHQHPYLPLDGRLASSAWPGFLSASQKPKLIDPQTGFIVTANQNILSGHSKEDISFGDQGSEPYRALQIIDRIEGVLKREQKISFDQLSAIQLDDSSLEAKELAKSLGAICRERAPAGDNQRQNFASLIESFDGRYSKESFAALPYEILIDQIVAQRLHKAFGSQLPKITAYTGQLRYATKSALKRALSGQATALFSVSEVDKAVGEACESAYREIVKTAGSQTFKWRWGRNHYLKRQSPLAKAPIVGGFFSDKRREVAGSKSSPMAESGTPVRTGANLRFKAKMTEPPQVFAVIDSGNSGNIGDKNCFDQVDLWHEGKDIAIETDWLQAVKNSKTSFKLKFRANRSSNDASGSKNLQ